MLHIRPATIGDLPEITEIYNDAILKTTATFDTEPKTLDEQKVWFEHHDASFSVIVAEENGVVLGWASLSRWSDRCAYSKTGEVSLYVRESHRGKGIGRKLFETIMEEGKQVGLHTVLSRIAQDNPISIHLHEEMGFKEVGVMREVGVKFGKLLNVHLLQKIYE